MFALSSLFISTLMELSCVSYISTWIWKKMSKAIICDWPNKSSTQQAAPPRIMHLQFSMQKKVSTWCNLEVKKRTFSIEAGEGGACLKIALWKTNLWSWLFLCALFSGCGFYASFWREIRIWCKIFFKPFAWINSERRRGMVLSFVIWSGAKSASSDPPLVQSYYVSGGKQTAMLGRVTLLYQELSFNLYSVPVLLLRQYCFYL